MGRSLVGNKVARVVVRGADRWPAVGTAAQIIATFGLIEVGETILDPFGNDPEDFALLHFVEVSSTLHFHTRLSY